MHFYPFILYMLPVFNSFWINKDKGKSLLLNIMETVAAPFKFLGIYIQPSPSR